MNVIYDFKKDIQNIILSYVPDAKIDTSASLDKLLRNFYFFNVRLFFPSIKKSIYISKELINNKLYLTYKTIIDEISDKLQKGLDIQQYLSKKIIDTKYDTDISVKCFDIHHFHLSKAGKKNGDDLLFVFLNTDKADDVYFLDIASHKFFLKNQYWFNILFNNWGHLKEDLNLNSIKGNKISDDFRNKLSYNDISFCEEIQDGVNIFSNKTSIQSFYIVEQLKHNINILENKIKKSPFFFCNLVRIPYNKKNDLNINVLYFGVNNFTLVINGKKIKIPISILL